VRFAQGSLCLVHTGTVGSIRGDSFGALTLGSCGTAAAEWKLGHASSGTEGTVPVITSADPALLSKTPLPCLHIDRHDKNGTCDGTPSTNRPVVQKCAHGNDFTFSSGMLRNNNCNNWGNATCLVLEHPNSAGSAVITAACSGPAAIWTLK